MISPANLASGLVFRPRAVWAVDWYAPSKDPWGIGLYGPALDQFGNSIAAVTAMEHISHRLGLHVFEYEQPVGGRQ